MASVAVRPAVTALDVVGGRPLSGEIPITGLKHSVIAVVAASVLVPGWVQFDNVPDTEETSVLVAIVRAMGGEARYEEGRLRIRTDNLRGARVPAHLWRTIHGSLYLMPTLLARFGHVELGPAGGDQIGDPARGRARPVEHMLRVLERFGAVFERDGPLIRGRCPRFGPAVVDIADFSDFGHRACGPLVSGATKTALLAAMASEGTTVIRNPHDKECEADLAAFMESCGYKIERDQNEWWITPGPFSSPPPHTIVSDPGEIMTFVAAAVHTRSTIRLTGLTQPRLGLPLRSFETPATLAAVVDAYRALLVTRRPEWVSPRSCTWSTRRSRSWTESPGPWPRASPPPRSSRPGQERPLRLRACVTSPTPPSSPAGTCTPSCARSSRSWSDGTGVACAT